MFRKTIHGKRASRYTMRNRETPTDSDFNSNKDDDDEAEAEKRMQQQKINGRKEESKRN